MKRQLSRRHFLRGVGVCVALPAFHSLLPKAALANALAPAVTPTGAPLRMAFLYVPNGVNVNCWRPEGEGADYQLNRTMEPLADFKQDFQVFSGLEHKNGWAGPDGAGDHARANATILTGARPKKTSGSDIRLGISVDQLAANHVGRFTRFPSLELSCDGVRKSGSCDSGYSCAYQFNLAWRSETTPVAPESNPRLVFERLFGAGDAETRKKEAEQRQAKQSSILDFVQDDARRLHHQLGRNDQQKLDEYLTGVREIERRLEQTKNFTTPNPGVPAPEGQPDNYRDHIRLMCDMMVLAFQTDSTRVATFLLAHDGSNRSFKDIGVSEGHHELSHHQNDKEKLEKIAKIDQFYAEQLAYVLGKMRNVQDIDGRSLLENSMVIYASGLADPDRHAHDNLPVILAGHGGGSLNPGRHVKLGENTPMTNLYVGMLNVMGVPVKSFGDSTGRLETI